MSNIPRKEYPRPQFVRENWMNLNGTWAFEIDNGRSGEARGLQKVGTALSGEITVPFCPESELSGVQHTDFMYGVWYNLMEDYVIHKKSPGAELVRLTALEPYRSNNPWSKALEGKRVLVVHPFEESIKTQFAKREKIFENPDVLPKFELITYRAVQTNAGGTSDYKDWFAALDAMFNDIKKIDFDIAIVGCGAYGLPLSAKIKDLGKQVIHLAGATQIMFGIRGARWDVRPDMQKYFNSYWIRPSESEKPKNAKAVENACYW